MKLEFFGQIFEKHSNFMKICLMGAEFFDAERWTDMMN